MFDAATPMHPLFAAEDTFHHVRDFPYFELPRSFGVSFEHHGETVYGYKLPEIAFLPSPTKLLHYFQGDLPLSEIWGFQLTKFMVLQVVAGLLVLLVYRGLARRLRNPEPVKGRWWNFWETLAVFIRDEVVRPTIEVHDDHEHGHGEQDLDELQHDPHGREPTEAEYGNHVDSFGSKHRDHHDAGQYDPGDVQAGGQLTMLPHAAAAVEVGHPADRYLPFVWSCFFYVLFCNLLGAVPMMGSATAEINVTAALAIAVVLMVIIVGTKQSGFVGFWTSLAPSMDVPGVIKPVLMVVIWVIELLGFVIKHGVLAVRLFANIMAGHTVIAVILGFIAVASGSWLFYLVAPASVLGQVAIGLLELFVAFLQAYIFAFLASLFISAAVHPH